MVFILKIFFLIFLIFLKFSTLLPKKKKKKSYVVWGIKKYWNEEQSQWIQFTQLICKKQESKKQ